MIYLVKRNDREDYAPYNEFTGEVVFSHLQHNRPKTKSKVIGEYRFEGDYLKVSMYDQCSYCGVNQGLVNNKTNEAVCTECKAKGRGLR
jgi:hypothetical protein